MKIALKAVVDECNRLAAEAEAQAEAALLKARIAQLEMDYASGKIDEKTYSDQASEILRGLSPHQEGPAGSEGAG